MNKIENLYNFSCERQEVLMSRMRKSFSKEFKAKVALEAVKGLKTSAEISSEYAVQQI